MILLRLDTNKGTYIVWTGNFYASCLSTEEGGSSKSGVSSFGMFALQFEKEKGREICNDNFTFFPVQFIFFSRISLSILL